MWCSVVCCDGMLLFHEDSRQQAAQSPPVPCKQMASQDVMHGAIACLLLHPLMPVLLPILHVAAAAAAACSV